MNERIRELSDIAYKNHLARNPHSSFGRRYDYDKEFAELIIAECTQVLFVEAERLNELSSEETNLAISDDLESCAEKCMDNIVRIEEHFGVEL
jgi:hypothetical protein